MPKIKPSFDGNSWVWNRSFDLTFIISAKLSHTRAAKSLLLLFTFSKMDGIKYGELFRKNFHFYITILQNLHFRELLF